MISSIGFQSPRGDFGFLKAILPCPYRCVPIYVSIPSRGFWFFEAITDLVGQRIGELPVSIPSRGFWFFEDGWSTRARAAIDSMFQSPRGDFGFLKRLERANSSRHTIMGFNPLAGILVF